jgi:hypothetical protein
MESVFYNGGMIGKTLDFGTTERYIISTSQQRVRPTFVGSQSFGRAGSTSSTNVGFALSDGTGETVPQAGDLVLLTIAHGAETTTLMTAPSGYTQLARFAISDSNDTVMYVGYKIMGVTPDTTFPVVSSLSTANAQTAIVFVFRGVDATTPIDVTTTTATGTNGRQANPPAITPVTTNSTVVAIGAGAHTATSVNYTTADLTKFKTLFSTDTYDIVHGVGYFEWTSGTYDPVAFSTSSSSTSDSWCAATVALRPALADVPVYGNFKNSGIWNLQSAFDAIPLPPLFITASAVATGSSNSLVISVPTHQSGDLLVAFMLGSFSGDSDWTQGSWIQLYERSGNGGPAIFYKVAGVSEPSTYTFTQTNNNTYSGAIAVFRNAQIDVVGNAVTDTQTLVAPSITVSKNNSILVGFYGANSASRTPSTPTGMNNRIMDNNASSPSFAVFTQTVDQGSSGTRSSTIGTTTATTGLLFSLKSSQ